jgi:Tol biopolymer transport system component
MEQSGKSKKKYLILILLSCLLCLILIFFFDKSNLFSLQKFIARILAGTQGQYRLAFITKTPDGDFIRITNIDGTKNVYLKSPFPFGDHVAWSPDGTKIAYDCTDSFEDICLIELATGHSTIIVNSKSSDIQPVWSPDGSKIAYSSRQDNDWEVFVVNADGTNRTNLTNSHPEADSDPVWSPDGSKIAFGSYRDGIVQLYIMNADGSNQINLSQSNTYDFLPNWSSDSKRIFYTALDDTQGEIYVINIDGTNKVNLTKNPADDQRPILSPNEKYVAFLRDDSLYIMNPDGSELRHVGGEDMSTFVWSPDNQYIVLWDGGFNIYTVNLNCLRLAGGCTKNIVKLPNEHEFYNNRVPAFSPVRLSP